MPTKSSRKVAKKVDKKAAFRKKIVVWVTALRKLNAVGFSEDLLLSEERNLTVKNVLCEASEKSCKDKERLKIYEKLYGKIDLPDESAWVYVICLGSRTTIKANTQRASVWV